MTECNHEDTYQRWIYYNNEFYLSKDSSKKLRVSGITHWTKGSTLPYLPKAIVLTGSQVLHSPLCLQDVGAIVTLGYCRDYPEQHWAMDDKGLIRNENTGMCIHRSDPNTKSPGMLLASASCYDADEWHWRDGSLYLDSDEEYLIESDETGRVIMGYIPNERTRGTHQRWVVGSKRYSDYHRSTNSVRIRNEAAIPIECSLSQIGPLYWGVIYPD